jgi:hypothetical protein
VKAVTANAAHAIATSGFLRMFIRVLSTLPAAPTVPLVAVT